MASDAPAGAEIERLRLENETLSAVVGVVSSGPDLSHILDRVVDLLTRATDCHACFVYLRAGERLEMRAASPIYSHLVGRISFGVDEGLAGWAVRNCEAAFIREGAIEDPRTHYVPELEEERFQSMVAVPIPARDGTAIGAIVLHTVAPREFDERILNVLSRAAALVAGAIENARLYEDAKERVAALTRLAEFGREVAAVGDRKALFELAARGVRSLIDADAVRIYSAGGTGGRLVRVSSDPGVGPADVATEGDLVTALLGDGGLVDGTVRARLLAALEIDDPEAALDAVELSVGGEMNGALVVVSRHPWQETTPEMLRAAAQQVALAAEKIGLIEHLTEENLARDLFDALGAGDLQLASRKVEAARLERSRPRFVLEARPIESGGSWSEDAVELERKIRAAVPQAFCDLSSGLLRALVPVAAAGMEPVRAVLIEIRDAGALENFAVGVSEARIDVEGMATALREARDAGAIAARLGRIADPLLYRDTGAYRYLIDILDEGGPGDHLRAAVDEIVAYDRERGTQLLDTLDEYLSSRGNIAVTSRSLFIHVNTLRQRLERIEELTGLKIADEDFLALQLAVKLGHIRR
ncbi:MAG: helix-turn-helix domain-containing protein [Actinobacteria bacterium]|nr:helix-turn-helix domain-containing protein [Actinomycetota bacterium]